METYILIRIKEPTEEECDRFSEEMGLRKFVGNKIRGQERVGPEFQGTHTVAAVANAYAMELVCRVLTQARVPYSLHKGKPIRKRGKKCGTSTQSNLTMVALISEVQSDPESD